MSTTGYHWAYLEEGAKRAIRRALLKAVCLPGHQIPFASRDMPVARGWGSGGLQVTLAAVVPGDTVKVAATVAAGITTNYLCLGLEDTAGPARSAHTGREVLVVLDRIGG